ncbi:hypothetical protein [uncultured Tateyamaria sp.]|uniref:hypothetical protein n=1 Tax=uncultured Tateyamaria sp. TaxID=455651 RepID=UPI00263A002F|nr:hypothetical protein [uncultured Tateyamaria sp.]
MKICMIGDSHLAMMMEAAKAYSKSECDITAVTWPRQFEDQFSYQGSQLMAMGPELAAFWKSGGYSDRIELTKFDKIVFVSHTVTMFNIFNILRDHVVSDWNGGALVVEAVNSLNAPPNRRRLLTSAAFHECLKGIITSNYAFRIAAEARAHCAVPICVLPAPFLAEGTLTHRPNLNGLKRILNRKDGANLARAYNDAHVAAFADVTDVTVVPQPAETITRACLTKEDYRVGATKFGTDDLHRADDVMHAGPLMGQLLLKDILA